MKAGFDQNSTMKWLLTTIISTNGTDVFNQRVDNPNWDCNGVEFKNIGRVMQRLHDHMEKQNDRISELENELRLFNEIKELVRGME